MPATISGRGPRSTMTRARVGPDPVARRPASERDPDRKAARPAQVRPAGRWRPAAAWPGGLDQRTRCRRTAPSPTSTAAAGPTRHRAPPASSWASAPPAARPGTGSGRAPSQSRRGGGADRCRRLTGASNVDRHATVGVRSAAMACRRSRIWPTTARTRP
jgi:hypothetical protein